MSLKSKIAEIINEIGGKPYVQITADEAFLLSTWLQLVESETVLEIGTAFGATGKIIKTALPECKLITLDLPVDPKRKGDCVWIKKEEDLGRYLPDDAIQETGDVKEVLPGLLEKYRPDAVFHDDGHEKGVIKLNLKQCYKEGIKWLIIHDSQKDHMRKYFKKNPFYEEIFYYKDRQGISLLRRKK